MIYELYGKMHYFAKKVTGRANTPSYRFVSVGNKNLGEDLSLLLDPFELNSFFNEATGNLSLKKNDVYPLENIVPLSSFKKFDESFAGKRIKMSFGADKNSKEPEKLETLWKTFIDNSTIPEGYRNEGLHYAGFIADCDSWCLPSWVWTNAAIVKLYCELRNVGKAARLADRLIACQCENG
ncbi:MAG: hypothetical protein SPL80_03330, partial [Bacilli bacterium]|nr:hypothetical protein [Bacilli bacterium]